MSSTPTSVRFRVADVTRRARYDADELVRRMIADVDSDWPERLLAGMARVGYTRHDLTPAELAALGACSHGLTDAMAGEVLGKTTETIKAQLKAARMKLRAKNTAHAIAIALREGLIT
jgi:DNA-binding CsgD family transcriptional regulator